ncbi:MAG: hypothetical protein RLZZ324_1074 [Candidatus Parcubacteria bacterium]|jgi:hypothetical protein
MTKAIDFWRNRRRVEVTGSDPDAGPSARGM